MLQKEVQVSYGLVVLCCPLCPLGQLPWKFHENGAHRPKLHPRKRSQQAKARGLHRTMRALRDRPRPHDDAHCRDDRERSGTREEHGRR